MLVVTCICTCVRNVPSPLLKLRLVRLLTEVASHCQDAIRTGRILPYLVALLSDPLPSVRAEAVAQVAQLLAMVSTLQPTDLRLMPDYVIPALSRVASDPDEMVRCALAARIGELAQSAQRLLEVAHWMRTVSLSVSLSLAAGG